MLVPGAMAAMWAASVTNTPAEPAWAPLGETYTTMGTLLEKNAFTIPRVDFSSPPGVSRIMMRALAFSSVARAMEDSMYRCDTPWIAPSMVMTSMRGAVWGDAGA